MSLSAQLASAVSRLARVEDELSSNDNAVWFIQKRIQERDGLKRLVNALETELSQ
jgi:hypothetical protein